VGGVVGVGVAVAALSLLMTVVRQGAPLPAATRPDDVLLLVLGWVGVLLAAWLALGSLLTVAALLPGAAGRAAASVGNRITPLAARKVLALMLGASTGSLALPPAPVSVAVSVAGSGPVARSTDPGVLVGGSATTNDLAPGFAPTEPTPGFAPTVDRGQGATTAPSVEPTVPPTPAGPGYVPTAPPPVHDTDRPRLLAPAPRPTSAAHDLLPVRRGDSLWSIAARHLGPAATDAEIAWEWPRWYAANRAVVGDDPDRLTPGQLLRPPPATFPATAALPSTPGPGTHTGTLTTTPAEQGAPR
jgi:nucleoid-associated protein YgaU